jgi:galacturan 1,4-alpha-galacturonidase
MLHSVSILNTFFSSFLSLVTLGAATSSCSPNLPSRPSPTPHPYSPGKPHIPSPPRSRTCYVHALGKGQDDSQAIFSAAKACNYGGTVALLDAQYIIAQPLDLTFLNAVDIVIVGEVSFTPNIPFWVANSFKYTYQTASLFWQIGGTDVNIYGGGTINGNGQVWWDAMTTNSTLQRPILMGIMGLRSGTISNLKLINPPNWFHFVANSSDLIFDSMSMTAISNDTNAAKNSGECFEEKEVKVT